ncbi:MAG: glycerophosphodiester phosphodiesterase family protein [Clostridia bacterium]|nr:glycerophosphodiester phosphodiesterase family protein [Clostridia bacterium]
MHGKIKYVSCILIFILLLSLIGCGRSSVAPQGQPAGTEYKSCTIVTPASPKEYENRAAEALRTFFGGQFKQVQQIPEIQYQKAEQNLTIFVGGAFEGSGYAAVYAEDGITIAGASSDLTYLATMQVIYEYFTNNPKTITVEKIQSLNIREAGVSRETYIQDITQFTPVWKYQWTPPAWMLDFEEKQQSYTLNGRMMCVAHRGGIQFYPENSIESTISSIQMGCDIIEIDVQRTKDGVLVLLHADLDVCTDWAEKKGKNGLPKSSKVVGWTYEQLQQLNLRFDYGQYTSAEGEITPYKIPTLEEVMIVCKDRIYVNIDKLDCVRYWDDVYSVLKKTNTTQNYLFGGSFKEQKVDLKSYRTQMSQDGLPVSSNYYARKHCGNLTEDLTITAQAELEQFFKKYYQAGNNFLTDHPFECVQWLGKK